MEPVYYNNVDKMMKGANDMVRKMRVAKRLTELVGNTPLMEMGGFSGKRGLAKAVIAKIEYFNPGGSVKDRIALAIDRKSVV